MSWGVWMIEGYFSRLKDPLQYEEIEDRHTILRLMAHLYNFHTSQISTNQILSSFCEKTGYFGYAGINNDANGLVL